MVSLHLLYLQRGVFVHLTVGSVAVRHCEPALCSEDLMLVLVKLIRGVEWGLRGSLSKLWKWQRQSTGSLFVLTVAMAYGNI